MGESHRLGSYQLHIPGYTQAEADALFLKLDASNDPITGPLLLNSTLDVVGIATIQGIPYASDDSTNIFIGTSAGANNAVSGTDGIKNFFLGPNAGNANTSGDSNIAIGGLAFRYNTTGSHNVCIGEQAGEGVVGNSYSDNICLGNSAGRLLKTGTANVYIGKESGSFNETGQGNTYIGRGAGTGAGGQSQSNNVAIGRNSCYSITTAQKNACVGNNTLYNNQTGSFNTAIGHEAGQGVSTNSHSNNTFIGYQAGLGITTGSNNLLLGYKAADNLTTGSNNLIIGYDLDAPSATADNQLSIGGAILGQIDTGEIQIPAKTTVGVAGFDLDADHTNNIFIGNNAGISATQTGGLNGTFLTFIGRSAGTANSTGYNNVAIGGDAFLGNQTGYQNVSVGGQTNYRAVSGVFNTAVGHAANFGTSGQTANNVTAVGMTSLNFNYGDGSTAIGSKSAAKNTDGTYGVAIGYQSCHFNQTGDYNICIGSQAGYGIISNSHSNNAFIGRKAGFGITTGGNNVAIGYESALSLTTGADNMVLGYQAMYFNETGTNNVCIGKQAGYGATGQNYSQNTFIGNFAGYNNTTGTNNVGIGLNAGFNNLTGGGNMCIGAGSGQGTAGGNYSNNTFIGSEAGKNVSTGSSNIGIGLQALYYNKTGAENTFIGNQAGTGAVNQNHSRNTAIGFKALLGVTTGNNNLALGYQAADNLTTGANNIIIGYDLDASAVGVSNELNIGGLITGDTSIKTLFLDGDTQINGGKELRFSDVGDSNYVGFKAPALTGNQIWTLPAADGNANDILTTDGSGNLAYQSRKDLGIVIPVAQYISGTGTAGADATAQTVKTIVLPAGCLSQVGDRVRVRCYWTGDTGTPVTGTNTTNGVTCAAVTDGGAATFQVSEYWLHYIDATHANIISMAGGVINTTLSSANVAGFNFAIDQDLDIDQDSAAGNHIIVYFFAADVFPKPV